VTRTYILNMLVVMKYSRYYYGNHCFPILW